MKKIELKEYPLSTELIKDWYMEKMLESFKDKTVPEEFKQMMLDQGIEIDKIETLININPHSLFEFFDNNELYIQIGINSANNNTFYQFKINDFLIGHFFRDLKYTTRKETETNAIIEALDLLENKLKPIEFPVL